MSDAGYRSAGEQRRAYDPEIRMRPCESCGEAMVVGDSATVARCGRCGREQAVPEVRVVSLAREPEMPESVRLELLRKQLAHPWEMPAGAVEFANALTTEISLAHRAWVERLERVQQDPKDTDAAHELLNVTDSVANAARRIGGPERGSLARRAYWEATTEALWASPLRAFGFSIMATGSIAIGGFDDARAWLDRMDPQSSDLLANSCYLLPLVILANRQGDHERVVQLLGRIPQGVPVHSSMRTAVAVHQAHALEQLGDLAGAVEVLVHESKRLHSSLVAMAQQIRDRTELRLCERSFPIAMERALAKMLDRVPSRSRDWGVITIICSALAVVVALVRAEAGYGLQAGAIGAVGGVGIAAGIALSRYSRKYRLSVLRGCIPVRGRVLNRTPGTGDEYIFEVVVERKDMPDLQVTMTETLSPRVAATDHTGRAFDALWNPDFPTLFHKMSVTVSQADIDRGK